MDALRALGLPVPEPVLEQVCSDHGRNCEFQSQYGALDLGSLRWSLENRAASELKEATVYEGFQRWAESVEARVQSFKFKSSGWACIDVRREIVAHWETYHTWLRPPVFIDAEVLGRGPGLHLMGGHTRLGILRGLVNHGVIPLGSHHAAWIGTIQAPQSSC